VTERVKWGVIGSGGIARRRTIPEGIVPARNARLVAVYGTNPRTNNEVAKEFSALPADSIEVLLRADIDAVYIASPVHAHLEQVRACARAGKHVFCEKPLGCSLAEAEEIVAACRNAGVQLGTAFMMRFQSQHEAAARLIGEGKLGKPVYGRAQLSCWYPPMPKGFRQDPALGGGGSLIDMGSHCIDLLEMFFGPVKSVSCFINNTVHSYRSEDSAVASLKFENGAIGSVDTFFCIQDNSSKNALELYGSKGSILATGTVGQASQGRMIAHLSPQEDPYDPRQARNTADGVAIVPEARNVYRAEIEHFDDVLLGAKPNILSGEIGLRNQRLIGACYESAKTGRVIEVGGWSELP
jgi:predicted dehydrogenase